MMNFLKKKSPLHILLAIWLILATVYVLYNEYNHLKVFVADRAYSAGITDSVMQILDLSQGCDPIPVTAGEMQVQLINVACLVDGTSETEGE